MLESLGSEVLTREQEASVLNSMADSALTIDALAGIANQSNELGLDGLCKNYLTLNRNRLRGVGPSAIYKLERNGTCYVTEVREGLNLPEITQAGFRYWKTL